TSISQGPVNSAGGAASSIVTGSGVSPASAVFSAPAPSSAVFASGSNVPLAAFSHMQLTTVPITINHQGQFPVVTLSFNLAPNASLGDAVNDVNMVKEELNMPISIQTAFQG